MPRLYSLRFVVTVECVKECQSRVGADSHQRVGEHQPVVDDAAMITRGQQ